jgi:hypothetical protein
MGFPIGKISSIATKTLSVLIQAIPVIQSVKGSLGPAPNQNARQAVQEALAAELAAWSIVAGHDLSHDPDVLQAGGVVIDAVVAYHTTLARKAAGAGVLD